MAVEYRSVLSVEGDLHETVRTSFESWLDAPEPLPGAPGIYQLAGDRELTVQFVAPGADFDVVKFSLAEGHPRARWTTSLTLVQFPTQERRAAWLRVEVESPNREDGSPRMLRQLGPVDLVGRLLDTAAAHDASAVVTSAPRRIDVDDVPGLIRVLEDPDRRYPALVVGRPPDDKDDEWSTRVQDALRGSVGMSSQYVLTGEAVEAFIRQVGVTNGVPTGAVRIYRPGLDLSSRLDGRRHRVLSPRFMSSSGQGLTRTALRSAALLSAISRPLPPELRQADSDLLPQFFEIAGAAVSAFVLDITAPPTTSSEPPAAGTEQHQDAGRGGLPAVTRADVAEAPAPASNDLVDSSDADEPTLLQALTDQLTSLVRSKADLEGKVADLILQLDDQRLDTADALDRARRAEHEVSRLRGLLAKTAEAPNAWAQDLGPLDLPADFDEVLERLDRGDLAYVEFTGNPKVTRALRDQDMLGNTASRAWEALQALNDYGRAIFEHAVKRSKGVHGYLSNTPEGFASWSRGHAPVESESVRTNRDWYQARVLPVPDGVADGTGVAFMEAHFKVTGASGNYVRMHYLDDVVKSGRSYVGYLGPHLPNTHT